jgi:hypothetical protein
MFINLDMRDRPFWFFQCWPNRRPILRKSVNKLSRTCRELFAWQVQFKFDAGHLRKIDVILSLFITFQISL